MNQCSWRTRLSWTVSTGTWWEKGPVGIPWKQLQWLHLLARISSVTVKTTLKAELENLWNSILMVFGCCFLKVSLKMWISSSVTVRASSYLTPASFWTTWSTKNMPILNIRQSRMLRPLIMKQQKKWQSFSRLTALTRQWWFQQLSRNKKQQNSISNNIQLNFSRKGIACSTLKMKFHNLRGLRWKEEVN